MAASLYPLIQAHSGFCYPTLHPIRCLRPWSPLILLLERSGPDPLFRSCDTHYKPSRSHDDIMGVNIGMLSHIRSCWTRSQEYSCIRLTALSNGKRKINDSMAVMLEPAKFESRVPTA